MLKSEKISGILAGVSGEYFVAAQLSRLGYIASLTLKNTKGVDVLATNLETTKSITIQVKTNQGNRRAWLLNEKSEKINTKNLVFVFVNLLDKKNIPEFYIVPGKIVAQLIKSDYKNWIETPGKKGQQHRHTQMRMFKDNEGIYMDRWDLLGI